MQKPRIARFRRFAQRPKAKTPRRRGQMGPKIAPVRPPQRRTRWLIPKKFFARRRCSFFSQNAAFLRLTAHFLPA
jgi:hypothetical protein